MVGLTTYISFPIKGFSNTNWASYPDDRHSTTSYCIFFLFFGHNLIAWSSKKQEVVARSSTEFKYWVLAYATMEKVWIQHFHVIYVFVLSPRCYGVYRYNISCCKSVDSCLNQDRGGKSCLKGFRYPIYILCERSCQYDDQRTSVSIFSVLWSKLNVTSQNFCLLRIIIKNNTSDVITIH